MPLSAIYQYVGASNPGAVLFVPSPTNLPIEQGQVVLVKSPISGQVLSAAYCRAGSQSARITYDTLVGQTVDVVAFGLGEINSLYYAFGVAFTVGATINFDVAVGLIEQETNTKVGGVITVQGAPARRTVRAFAYDAVTHTVNGSSINESITLGSAVSDESTGAYEIELNAGFEGDVFVVAFDDYGIEFAADLAVLIGDRIHPTIPNGYVYEVTVGGTLASSEPVWSTNTEATQVVGSASVKPVMFYRPVVHGPITPISEPVD